MRKDMRKALNVQEVLGQVQNLLKSTLIGYLIKKLIVDGDDCLAIVGDGFEDCVSNTKTNYSVGKDKNLVHRKEV